MKFIKKNKKYILLVAIIIVVYFLTRLVAINSLPIFTDEAIYLRWSQIALHDANWRFISLTDGKQPLFIWFVMLAMKYIEDPLIAGRVVSVIAGFFTLIGLYFLGSEVFSNKKIGLLSSSLYLLYPFALVYDRMALYDSLVGTFAVWALFGAIKLVRNQRFDTAMLLGFVTGGAVLNKTSGFLALYLLPFLLVLMPVKEIKNVKRVARFILMCAVVAVITYGCYAILRLSPFFYIIEQKNALFVYPFHEWIKHPFTFFIPNIRALFDWYLHYVGLPMSLLVLGSFLVSKSYFREKILLFLWFFLPFLALALTGKTLYPRYIFFMTLFLLPLCAYTLIFLYEKLSRKAYYSVGFLAIIYWVISSGMVITQFQNAPIPKSDIQQYLTSWTSGEGVSEAIKFFRERSKDNKIFVGTQGTFGLMPYALELYLVDDPQIEMKSYWPVDNVFLRDIQKKTLEKESYVLFYEGCPSCPSNGIAPTDWPLEKVFQLKKIEPYTYLTIYKVIPQ
ncbi:MAG: glycosyltransferase family 39 protein [Candidatus Levybacteria bacterium]|nr:glycosyltransferase family 39 protein [Candidatus Levybacteria bacterium]